MTNRRNMLFYVALFMLVLSLPATVFAQTEAYCLDLDGEDCELYQSLQANQEFPTSTAMQASISGEISAEGDSLPFAVNLSGAFATDKEAYQTAVDTFGALTLGEVSLDNVVELLDGVVSAWDAELFIDLSGIEGAEMLTGGETIDLYFVDGVAYINAPLLALATGDPELEGVYGIDAFEVIDFLLSSVTMNDLAQLGNAMGGGMGDPGDFNAAFNEAFMGSFQQFEAGQDLSEEEISSFVSFVRLNDETVNGETLVVFETVVNVDQVFSIPAIREAIVVQIEQQDPGMDVDALVQGLQTGLAGSTVTVVEKWNPETNFLMSLDMNMNIIVDEAAMAEAMGETSAGDGQITMNFDISFMRENINQIEAITLPEGAVVVPLMEMLAGQ